MISLLSDHDHHWQEQFAQERSRLLTALGELTEGGVVENLQHIGSTSVPGLPARPCIDVGLCVWPFPLESHRQAALEALGYERVPGYNGAPEQRCRHSTDDFQLCIVEAGTEFWTNHLIIRDYLRYNEDARQTYSKQKQEWAESGIDEAAYREVKAQALRRMLDAAQRWWVSHHAFAPVEAIASELKEFPCPWYISGGWALDLFLGRVTRVHHDVDVVVSRIDQLALQEHMTARGWKLITPFEGRLEPWPPRMRLELPRHQVHALRDGAFIDFQMTDIEHGVWRYRRDPIVIRTTERVRLRTADGIPFLAPELVVLFKSKNTSDKERGKDQADFDEVYTHLEPECRAWLRWALTASDPTHPWIDRLS